MLGDAQAVEDAIFDDIVDDIQYKDNKKKKKKSNKKNALLDDDEQDDDSEDGYKGTKLQVGNSKPKHKPNMMKPVASVSLIEMDEHESDDQVLAGDIVTPQS